MNQEPLIKKYGAVLEVCSTLGLAFPQEFLPAEKEKIEAALLATYIATTDRKERDSIGSAFVSLSSFVPMEEALIAMRYYRHITDKNQRTAHSEDGLLGEQFKKITDRINREGERYLHLMKTVDGEYEKDANK